MQTWWAASVGSSIRAAHEQVPARAREWPHHRPVDPAGRSGREPRLDHDEEGDPGRRLGDHGRPRGARDAEVEADDQHQFEDQIQQVGRDEDHERRAVVGGAALDALRGERDQYERDPDGGDAEVLDRMVAHLPGAAEHDHQRLREDDERGNRDDAHENRQPHRLYTDGRRSGRPSGAEAAGDLLRRAVGEEVRSGDDQAEHCDGDRQAPEFLGTEPADDRRVDEPVERLDRERPQRGNCEREDPAVVPRRFQQHRPTTLLSRGRAALHHVDAWSCGDCGPVLRWITVPSRSITLSLPDELVRRAKIVAAARDSSVSAMVVQLLESAVGDIEDDDSLWTAEESTMRAELRRIGPIAWDRDEVHTRRDG
jgi:hypothetical protein